MTQPTAAPSDAGTDGSTPHDGAAQMHETPPAPSVDSGNHGSRNLPQRPSPEPPPSPDWPSDWRERLAGGDRRALEQLKRHGSPADLWKKARSLEQKLSSGEFRRDLPKDATEEQRAEWRRERGIPDTPKDYTIALPDGVVLGEADRPVVDAFTAAVHEKGWDNAKVNEALSWYYAEQERQQAARAEADGAFKQKAEAELRAEFGPDYTPNLNAVKNLLASMPEGAAGSRRDAERALWDDRYEDIVIPNEPVSHPAEVDVPPPPPKSGVTEGAVTAGGFSIVGLLVTVWEKFNEASETVQEAAIRAAGKASFWLIAGAVVAVGFVWWRRQQAKDA